MRILLFFFFLSVWVMSVSAQNFPEKNWEIIDADILGNFYLSDGTDLVKTKPDGSVVDEYQDQLLGDIYQIDCYKGLKVLVFHQSTNQVVLLDNQLAPLGEPIDLSGGLFYDVAAACLGTDDQLWIADEQTGQLKLVDRRFNVIQIGVVFRQYTSAEKIVKFAQRGNLLLMVTSDSELLIFDHFGSFVRKHSFKSLLYSWLGMRDFVYVSGSHLIKLSYEMSAFDTITAVGKDVKGVLESKNQLYLLEDNNIKKLK